MKADLHSSENPARLFYIIIIINKQPLLQIIDLLVW